MLQDDNASLHVVFGNREGFTRFHRLVEFLGLFGVEPPVDGDGVFAVEMVQHIIGHAVAVPVEDAVVVALPHEHVGHDFGEAVVQGLQDFVPLRQIEFRLLQVDEAIDNFILNAGKVVRALLESGGRRPARFRVTEAASTPVHPVKVEIGIVQAFAQGALAHLLDGRHHAHLLQVFLEQREVAQVFLTRDEVNREGLAVFFKNALAVHLVARFGKEGAGTVRIERVERRRRVLVAFPQVGIVAVQEEVLAEHVLFVHGLAVQEHRKGATDANVLELRLAQVDGHALETDGFLVEDSPLYGPALLHGIEVGLLHPDAARVDGVRVEILLLEGFECLRLVVHEAVADFFEVVLAAVPVLLEAPPVAAALQFNVAVLAEGLDFVRARDHRELVADLVEVLPRPNVLGEREHASRFPEVPPVAFLRGHLHREAVHHLGAVEAAKPDLENRREVLLVHDDVIVELHVFGGDGLAVAPPGPRIYVEGERLAVFGNAPAVGKDSHFSVFGRVQTHERLEHHAHELGGETVVVFPHVERLRHGGAPQGNGPAGAGVLGGYGVELSRGGGIERQFRAVQLSTFSGCALGALLIASRKQKRGCSKNRTRNFNRKIFHTKQYR